MLGWGILRPRDLIGSASRDATDRCDSFGRAPAAFYADAGLHPLLRVLGPFVPAPGSPGAFSYEAEPKDARPSHPADCCVGPRCGLRAPKSYLPPKSYLQGWFEKRQFEHSLDPPPTEERLRLTIAIAAPELRAGVFGSDGTNRSVAWTSLDEAAAGQQPFLVQVANDILALDADSTRLTDELLHRRLQGSRRAARWPWGTTA